VPFYVFCRQEYWGLIRVKNFYLVAIAALILIAGSCTALEIEGNSAVEETENLRIEVTPHTASSPVNKYNQAISFENTGRQSLFGVRAVLLFPEKPKISSKKWQAPEYGWVEHSIEFDAREYEWSRTSSGSSQNPYIATVYYMDDTNGALEKVVAWEHEVKSFSACGTSQCFYWDQKELVSGNSWEEKGTWFHSLGQEEVDGQPVWYYYTSRFDLAAGTKADWKIKYELEANAGKWAVALIKGRPDCLANSNCEKQWVLDPWWASDWENRYPINGLAITSNLNAGALIKLENVDFDSLNISCADLDDLRIVNEDTQTELRRLVQEPDSIMFNIESPLPAGNYSGKFYIYTNNSTCPAPPSNINYKLLEDFENMSEWTEVETGGASWELQSETAISGKALKMTTIGQHSNQRLTFSQDIYSESFGQYFRATEMPSGHFSIWAWDTDFKQIGVFVLNDNTAQYEADGKGYIFSTPIVANKWYYTVLEKGDSENTINYKLYDGDTMELLEEHTNLISMEGVNWSSPITFRYQIRDIFASESYTVFIDSLEVPGKADAMPSFSIGVEENNDLDNDGILDNLDQCLGTPAGEAVDAVGCACSQKVCDDGNPCTDDTCNVGTAECGVVNDNSNVCGLERDCAASSCVLKDAPPYFYWRLFPEDGHDYCLEGSCVQHGCEMVSEDFNADCSISNTSELEAKVNELEGKVLQLEAQNLELQSQISLLDVGLNALRNSLESFVALIDSYLFSLPKGLKEGMLCSALEQSGETSSEGFGLVCEISRKGKCKCKKASK